MIEFELTAIVADDNFKTHTIYLLNKEQQLLLPIKMSKRSAENLLIAKDKKPEPRPHIHNTVCRITSALNAKIKEVIISSCHNDIYYSYIRVQNGRGSFDIDAKPSDSLAIALRNKCPIYVNKKVATASAIKISSELLMKYI